jgi:restriction endonuclease S subunit
VTEWRQTTLDRLIKLQRGHDLPTSERRPGTIPVIGAAGQSGFHDTPIVKAPGVTVGRAGGSMGKATYCETDFWPLNTSLYVTDFLGNDPRFAYYLLGQIDFSGYNSGAAQPMLNRNYITKIPINLPGVPEQKEIAATLGALDDKIAINDRIVTISRTIGTDLFRAATAACSAPIAIEKLAIYLNRGQAPRYTENDDGIIVVNQKCVRDGRVILHAARTAEATRVHQERRLLHCDVLINSTGVGTLGRVGLWSHDLSATVDSHVTIVRVDPKVVPKIIGAFALLAAQSTIEALGEGSTGQTELSRSKLGRVEVYLPSDGRDALAAKLAALEAKAEASLHESHVLAELRDALLPQLMSGRLRVRDAERIVEDST